MKQHSDRKIGTITRESTVTHKIDVYESDWLFDWREEDPNWDDQDKVYENRGSSADIWLEETTYDFVRVEVDQ